MTVLAASCALKGVRFLGQTEDGLALELTGVQGARFWGQTDWDGQVLELAGVYGARFLGQIEGGRVWISWAYNNTLFLWSSLSQPF